jgi:hypothetical protein
MKTGTSFHNTVWILIPQAAFCALMLFAGCLRHRISIVDAYRLDDHVGFPMLVPLAPEGVNSGEFQTAIVSFSAGPSETKAAVRPDCAIEGSVFSLKRGSNSSRQSWVIRSPSAAGWDALGRKFDIDAQWRLFTHELARMYDRGCFPPGLPSQSVRSAIARRIPLLASDVPVFMYSDQGERFVNLAPDMEIRIQKVLAPGASAKSGSNAVQLQTAVFDIVPRRDKSLWLKRKRGAAGSEKPSREMQEFLTLDERFARTPELRLFLQGISENQSQSGAILLGTSNATQLDVLTDLIRQRGAAACLDQQDTACIDLPPGSVSLFSFIWINGRRATYPFGTSLASLLLLLPPQKQTEVLESILVSRRLSLDRYAGIQFPRNIEGAQELLLLPGDRLIGKGDGGALNTAAEIVTR